jgi:cell division septum initiation protein DivIVA
MPSAAAKILKSATKTAKRVLGLKSKKTRKAKKGGKKSRKGGALAAYTYY